jgi:nucleoside-diphosphate-sugar epimerase
MSHIAIVGGTSALAQRLIPALKGGHKVTTLGLGECDIPCNLLDSVDAIRFPDSTDAVVHLAAAFGGPTEDEIVRTVEINAVGTLKVCIAAQRARVAHVVVISSLSAQLSDRSPYYGVYSITKRQAEELAVDYCRRHSLLLTVLRPSQLYAEDEAFRRHQPLVYHMADCAEKGADIQIFGARDALRNYINADDMAHIIRKVLEQEYGGVHSCTFPKDVALSEVAAAALKAFAQGGAVVFRSEKPDIPDNVFDNGTEFYERIGFIPNVDIWEGMRRIAVHRRAEAR